MDKNKIVLAIIMATRDHTYSRNDVDQFLMDRLKHSYSQTQWDTLQDIDEDVYMGLSVLIEELKNSHDDYFKTADYAALLDQYNVNCMDSKSNSFFRCMPKRRINNYRNFISTAGVSKAASIFNPSLLGVWVVVVAGILYLPYFYMNLNWETVVVHIPAYLFMCFIAALLHHYTKPKFIDLTEWRTNNAEAYENLSSRAFDTIQMLYAHDEKLYLDDLISIRENIKEEISLIKSLVSYLVESKLDTEDRYGSLKRALENQLIKHERDNRYIKYLIGKYST